MYLQQWTGADHHRLTQIRWWKDRIGRTRLSAVTPVQVRSELTDYRQGVDRNPQRMRSAASSNRLKAALSAVFSFAIQRGYGVHNPVRLVPAEPENNHRVRFLSDGERTALLAACRHSRWDKLYLLVVLALMTGSRKGELLGIHWEQVDWANRSITLPITKNGTPRVLSLPQPAIDELLRFAATSGLVFASNRRPQVSTDGRDHWDAAREAAGLVDFKFHDLRHSAASYLAMGGASLLEVGDVLGHRSVQTTKRYAHLSVGHKQALTDRLLGGLV